MKKYLLTLCMTMLSFVTSWAQWAIDVSTAPVYVEVEGRNVGAGGSPNVREYTITTPTDASGYTVEAVEVVAEGKTAGQYATASTPVYDSGTGKYKVTFSPASATSVGITHFYLQIKQGGTVVSSTAAMPFEVNVFDMTKARYLINPGNQKITTSTTKIPVSLAPVTATSSAEIIEDNSSSRITLNTPAFVDAEAANNIVYLSINASSAQLNDAVTIKITPPTGSKDRDGKDVLPVTFTLTVDKPEFPITYPSLLTEFRVGENWTSTLNAPAGSEYTVDYSITLGYPEDVIGFIWNESDKIHSSLTTKKVGQTQIWTIITPTGGTGNNGEKWADYRPWIRPLDITVREALLQPILTATQGTDANTNKWTPTLKVNIDPKNGDVGNAVFTGDLSNYYDVEYSLEGAIPETATVDPITGLVTVTNIQAAQIFYLVATVTPKKAYEGLCVGGTARAAINVTGSMSQGAYLYRNTDDDWTAYTVDPGSLGGNIFANYHIMDKDANGEFKEVTDATTKATLLQKFKDATNIKVMGTISSYSVAQLAHAIGTDWAHVDQDRLKTLDMSGCIMVDQFNPSQFPVTRDDFTENPTTRQLNFVNVKKFVLPRPAIGVENGTVLPAEFNRLFTDLNTNSKSNIESLVIPEGWTEIANNFSRINSIWGDTPYKKLTELKLPNSMEKVGAFAFSGFHVQVLTMPYNIHRINEGAFATSPMLQDVYFTGPAPEFVHTLAFSGVTQMCNNTVHDQELQGVLDPDITRYEYYNGTNPRVLACILHFPEQYRSYYTDVTREYKRLTQAEVDAHNAANPGSTWPDAKYSKGYKLYVPEGWTSAFIQQVRNKKIDYNAYVSDKVDYGVKDAYYGLDMIWPSQNQMSTGFAIAQAGYQWSGQPLRTADQYNPAAEYGNNLVDRRGLYQFIVAMGNADIQFEFELGKWYTIALPFNMTPEQIRMAFGPDTQVCRFSKVTRVTEDSQTDPTVKKKIVLEFRKSVMGDITGGEYDGTDFKNDYEHPHAEEGTGSDHDDDYYGTNKTGIIHHFPYMIRPAGTIVENEYVSSYDGKYHFNSSSFERISGTLHPDVRRTDGVIGSTATPYAFTPILSTTKIKPNSYVLVDKDNTHKYAFYKGVKNTDGVYEPGGKANQNTAYVQLSVEDGQNDYNTFFKAFDPKAQAKVFTYFAYDEEDATEIEEVVIACGQDSIFNDKIYTINGQQVSGSHLPAGIYIKNGKKILIK